MNTSGQRDEAANSEIRAILFRLAPEMEALLRQSLDALVEEPAQRAAEERAKAHLRAVGFTDESILIDDSSRRAIGELRNGERARILSAGLPAAIAALLAALDAARKAPP